MIPEVTVIPAEFSKKMPSWPVDVKPAVSATVPIVTGPVLIINIPVLLFILGAVREEACPLAAAAKVDAAVRIGARDVPIDQPSIPTLSAVMVTAPFLVIVPPLAIRDTVPPLKVMLLFKIIAPSATRVSVPVPASVIESVTVMLPTSVPVEPVVIVTEAAPRVASMVAGLMLGVPDTGTKVFCALRVPVPLAMISTLIGSKSQSPPCPFFASKSTKPSACRFIFEDVSTNPPFPPKIPPCAEISP